MTVWWDKRLKQYRPYPHLSMTKTQGNTWKCRYCGEENPDCNALCQTSCAERPEPCKWCGESPLCAPDCMGIALALSAPEVFVIGESADIGEQE